MKASKSKRSEYAYVCAAYKRLRQKGIPSLWEAPLMGRSIDLLFLEGNNLVSVEFKLKDWRRALLQARDHQIGSDYAYICLTNQPSEMVFTSAKKAGIGVMLYAEGNEFPFIKLLQAPRSKLTWPQMRERLCGMLRIPDQIGASNA